MQQLGNTSTNSCKLAETLVKDYFILVPSAVHRLKALPLIGPQFAANFLTAVGEIYFTDNKKGGYYFPPGCLLETVTLWVTDNHKLCVAAQQTPSALPPGAIAMEATTPLAGLFKWCILAPLYNEDSELYSQLHLSLLNTLVEMPTVTPPRAISAQQLALPAALIQRFLLQSQTKHRKGLSDNSVIEKMNNSLSISLDRYAQAVQVALFVNCVYGNVDDLMNQLIQLPHDKLLEIVITTHKQNK